MNFTPMAFVNNLYYMGVGMLSIFGVIGIIVVMTMLLNTIKVPDEKDNDKK